MGTPKHSFYQRTITQQITHTEPQLQHKCDNQNCCQDAIIPLSVYSSSLKFTGQQLFNIQKYNIINKSQLQRPVTSTYTTSMQKYIKYNIKHKPRKPKKGTNFQIENTTSSAQKIRSLVAFTQKTHRDVHSSLQSLVLT